MYEFTQLFWYKSIFMTELICAEFLFTFKLKKRSKYFLRMIIMIVICYLVAFAYPIISYDAFYCSLMFFILFVVTVVMLKFCYKETWLNIIFCSMAGYTTQHIAYELYDFIINICNLNQGSPLGIYGSSTNELYAPFTNPITELIYFFDYFITYWLLFNIFGSKISKNEDLQLKNLIILFLVILVVVVDIFLSSLITYYSYDKFDKFYISLLCVFNILCCFLAMCIQFEMSLRKKLQKELVFLNNMRHQEQEQFTLVKENIELINLKCHDLKHQIRQIGNNSSLSSEAISEMENIISIYDSKVKTGNEALDIILTEKSLFCNKNKIKLSCIVDGAQLNFMTDIDLYSLFGNMLDNAIEAVKNLSGDKRVIGVTVKERQCFLSINVHNYYEQELSFEQGLPQTTKADKGFHGYGMKSIRLICEKYEGDLSIKAENSIFNINILFPLQMRSL